MVGADNLEALRVGQIALRHPTTQDPAVSRLAAKAAPAIPSAFARAGIVERRSVSALGRKVNKKKKGAEKKSLIDIFRVPHRR